MLPIARAKPQRVLPSGQPWPLFDVAASRAIEATALKAHPPGALMQTAGRAVAHWAMALAPHAQRFWIAAGPGGNGGDGLHAAADLASQGREVVVSLLADPARLGADAALGLQRAQAAGARIAGTLPETHSEVVIDALLGLGNARAAQGPMALAIQRLNAVDSALRLAVDLPSGLHPDNGARLGADAVRAAATLSLLTLKPGLFTASGRELAGQIWLADLGCGSPADTACAVLSDRATATRTLAHPRPNDGHKGRFGDVLIVGGAQGMTGAARLAAHAAQAAGAGRTLLSLLDPDAQRGDVTRPEWLWPETAWQLSPPELLRMTVVCGCGGGALPAEVMAPLLTHAGCLVLDADGLNAVAREPALARLLAERAKRGRASILTPHPLEAARLLACDTATVQTQRLSAAQALADRFQSVVALKGSGTVVAAPGARPVINSTGSAALATGGTGDVLAGWLGGLWSAAAGVERGRQSAQLLARECAVAACWLHGAAADGESAQAAVRALDLVQGMRRVADRLVTVDQ